MPILQVPITKSKGFVQIDTDAIPEAVFAEIVLQGLKTLANRGMSKLTKAAFKTEEEFVAATQAKGESNAVDILAGNVKLTGGKAKKASGAVMTEARRLAKNLVKDAMKREGIKISHVDAKDITAAANALLAEDDTILEQAKANLAEREKVTALKIDVGSLVHVNPKKVAAAEAKKHKDQLSAKQAGKTKVRAKKEASAEATA